MWFLLSFLILCLPVFADGSCEHLRPLLGAAFVDGADPYAGTYPKNSTIMRYIEPIRVEEDCFLIDNLRALGAGDEAVKHPVWTSLLVDVNKLQRVYMMTNDFKVNIMDMDYEGGHAQLLFEFQPGGAITPQGEIKGFANSFEAYRDDGVPYDAAGAGMNGGYDSIFVFAEYNYTFHYAAERNEKTNLLELKLSQQEAENLLRTSLHAASDRQYMQANKYHTILNSCVSNQFRVMNIALPEDKKIPPIYEMFDETNYQVLLSGLTNTVVVILSRRDLMSSRLTLLCPDEALAYLDSANSFHAEAVSRRLIFNHLYR